MDEQLKEALAALTALETLQRLVDISELLSSQQLDHIPAEDREDIAERAFEILRAAVDVVVGEHFEEGEAYEPESSAAEDAIY